MSLEFETIHEHTVATNQLHPLGWVLDGGCRGWGFTEHFMQHKQRVVAVDADPDVFDNIPDVDRAFCAALSHVSGRGYFDVGRPPQARRIALESGPDTIPVNTITILDLMARSDVCYWELVKLDIEGAEIGILKNWPKIPIATQISVEFHGHEAPDYSVWQGEVDEVVQHLKECGMISVQHSLSRRHGLSVFNYWDSLFLWRERL
jgi:FkbM family methyltransferase